VFWGKFKEVEKKMASRKVAKFKEKKKGNLVEVVLPEEGIHRQ